MWSPPALNLDYQWTKTFALSNGGRISGAQAATLSITSFSGGDVGVITSP